MEKVYYAIQGELTMDQWRSLSGKRHGLMLLLGDGGCFVQSKDGNELTTLQRRYLQSQDIKYGKTPIQDKRDKMGRVA